MQGGVVISPAVIMGLLIVTSGILVVSLLAFLLPRKVRKFTWILLSIILLGYFSYYGVIRPFIIQNQTDQAIEVLEEHLKEKYPEDSWNITDTDETVIKPAIYLHVIFESEPRIVYEYKVKNTIISQEDIWTIAGSPIRETDIDTQHEE